MGNRAEWLLVDFAVTMLGAALVALNTWWRQRELHHALHLTGTSVLAMADRYLKHDYIAELAGSDAADASVRRMARKWLKRVL